MEDTVILAKEEREKQGPWEVEVSYGGEADLHRHLAGCDKNPGHQKFVPVDQFNVDHLPPGCQDNDLVDLVRALSDLTVRVSVKYVSERRPETEPGSDKPYPCYKNRGSNMMRVGTGWVWMVFKYGDEDSSNETCSCHECLISPTPKTHFAHIIINTAAHVVYDSLEAAHTTCHLFFDKGGTPRACSGVVTLRGISVMDSRFDNDWSKIRCVTHDMGLADRLKKMVDHWDSLNKKFSDRFDRLESEREKSSSQAGGLLDAWDNLTIIVSHPHGCSKQASVGYCVDSKGASGIMYARNYTTATCPGSSGAYVFSLKIGQWFYWSNDRVHRGNCEGKTNLNFCSPFFLPLPLTPGLLPRPGAPLE